MDHTGTAIAGPNNGTLRVISALALRKEPVIIGHPAFDSKYVSLETSAYGWPHLPKKLIEPSLTNSNGSCWRKTAVSAMRRFFRRRDGRLDQLRVLGGT
jgi:hypothetical protein